MKNYRTHCGHCKNYRYMGDYVTCGRPDGCVLNGPHVIEEIPLDFDRNAAPPHPILNILKAAHIDPHPDHTIEEATQAFLPEMVNVVSGPDIDMPQIPYEDRLENIRPVGLGGRKDVSHIIAEAVSATDRQVGGDHYASQAIQPIDYIFENGLGFCEGNVVKYVTRYKKKNGVEDLKKARHYLDMLIERLEARPW